VTLSNTFLFEGHNERDGKNHGLPGALAPARTLNVGARSPSAPRHPSNRVRKSIGRQAVKKPNEPVRPEVQKRERTESKVVVNMNG
jgi:hypothetical protein